MSIIERDPVTGHITTGHNWNGIKELNTPIPRIVIAFIIVTHLYALIAWVLLPTWPLGQTYTKGLLGIDQRNDVETDIARADAARADWTTALATQDFDRIQANADLMAKATATAAALFGQNCQACHGKEGTGGPGFPQLSDNTWLWGGTMEEVAETIRVGVNSTHPDSHFAQMPAFGRDQMLDRSQISTLTDYVMSLSDGVQPDDSSEGAVLFQDNCAACHGEDALGVEGTGAPNLTDADWLYGGDKNTIHTTLMNGRQGQMPSWADRLSEAQIKMLAIYVVNLSKPAS
ncbi:cytochrome-c oxidase, cbb3-type subunit III [Hoeflea sp.]|uniref:cytochrome-c oxidase, cbb3-type subunit III n=1 Tax=Hoeflea sp. TaxID=1940281 RepID=UPI002AFF1A29|nr:cytochrome-c oxidase, cbb3-type subunit III [Hoeflea sp.]